MGDQEKIRPEADEEVEGHSFEPSQSNPASANPAEREAMPVEDDDVEGHGFHPSQVSPSNVNPA